MRKMQQIEGEELVGIKRKDGAHFSLPSKLAYLLLLYKLTYICAVFMPSWASISPPFHLVKLVSKGVK